MDSATTRRYHSRMTKPNDSSQAAGLSKTSRIVCAAVGTALVLVWLGTTPETTLSAVCGWAGIGLVVVGGILGERLRVR